MERPWERTKKLSNVGKKGFHSYAKLNTHDLLFATLSIGIRIVYIFLRMLPHYFYFPSFTVYERYEANKSLPSFNGS